jgi:hypothetical protein
MDVKHKLTFEALLQGTKKIKNLNFHFKLYNDLIEHLWVEKGKYPLYRTNIFVMECNNPCVLITILLLEPCYFN